jgi:hypothetical protein
MSWARRDQPRLRHGRQHRRVDLLVRSPHPQVGPLDDPTRDAVATNDVWVKDSDRVRRKAAPWIRYVSGVLVTIAFAIIVVWTARAFGRSAFFAFGINWLLGAWAFVVAQYVPLRLPARYYRLRPFERAGRLYDRVGVRWYRRWLRRYLWTVDPALLRSRPGAREYMIDAAQGAEAGHLLILVFIGGITVWAAASGWWEAVPWLVVFNLLHNGYPVLSMRQFRARLERWSRPSSGTAQSRS